MDFPGRLCLADADTLEATLRVDDEFLAVVAQANEIGRWPLASCRMSRSGDRFEMTIGDERADFEPSDPVLLGDWIDRRWPATEDQPPEPASSPFTRVTVGQVAAGGAILVLLTILVTALVARDRPASTPLASVPTTTRAPVIPAVFTAGVDQITFAWNEAADRLRVDLFLVETPGPNRLQMNVGSGLVLYATEDPATGLVRTLMVSAGPTGDQGSGEAVLAVWGTLIAMVNPELDGEGRRALLADLGVSVDRPLPHGVSSAAQVGAAVYTLRSGVLGGKALLAVSPAT